VKPTLKDLSKLAALHAPHPRPPKLEQPSEQHVRHQWVPVAQPQTRQRDAYEGHSSTLTTLMSPLLHAAFGHSFEEDQPV
jgi:hypothetical protein